MTKDQLLKQLKSHDQFMEALDGLPEKSLDTKGAVGDWSIKDVINHLSRWEAEMVRLVWQVQQGQKPTTAHMLQSDVDQTNAEWFREGRQRPLENVMEDFAAVRKQTIRRVGEFSDKDLNDTKRFKALLGGERPLIDWIIGDSTDHEAEHREQILAWRTQNRL